MNPPIFDHMFPNMPSKRGVFEELRVLNMFENGPSTCHKGFVG